MNFPEREGESCQREGESCPLEADEQERTVTPLRLVADIFLQECAAWVPAYRQLTAAVSLGK